MQHIKQRPRQRRHQRAKRLGRPCGDGASKDGAIARSHMPGQGLGEMRRVNLKTKTDDRTPPGQPCAGRAAPAPRTWLASQALPRHADGLVCRQPAGCIHPLGHLFN